MFYETTTEKIVDGRSVGKIEGKIAVDDVVYPADSDRAGEIIVECGQKITKNAAETICTSGVNDGRGDGRAEEPADAQRPGRGRHGQPRRSAAADLPAAAARATRRNWKRPRPLFHEKFYDTNRYRLGRVGRFRINRKLELNVPEERDDAAARGPDRRDQVPAAAAAAAIRRPRSTTSTTWAIAACGRSTNWPATNCARASSSCAARCRSG